MKTLLIAMIFTVGSISTAFAGSNANCKHAAQNSEAREAAERQARATRPDNNTRPATGSNGATIDARGNNR